MPRGGNFECGLMMFGKGGLPRSDMHTAGLHELHHPNQKTDREIGQSEKIEHHKYSVSTRVVSVKVNVDLAFLMRPLPLGT